MGMWRRRDELLAGLLSLGCAVAALSAGGCRAGCGGGSEAKGEPPALLRRVAGSPEATPIAVDVDDERNLFLVAGMRGPIQVWSETDSGAAGVASIPVAGALLSVRFVPGGVFFAQEQGATALWSWAENRALFTHDFGSRARRATISPDRRYVALGGSVVDVASNREVEGAKPVASQSALAFSADSSRVVSAGFQEPWIAVRDLPGGATREWPAPGKVSHAVLSSTGDLVTTSMDDGSVHTWRQPSGDALGVWQGQKETRGLCFASPGSMVVVADPKGVSVVDATSGQRGWRADVDGTLWSFACDGGLAAAGTTEGNLWLWDVSRHVLVARMHLATAPIVALDISAVRHRLAAADERGEAAVWSWRSSGRTEDRLGYRAGVIRRRRSTRPWSHGRTADRLHGSR